MHDTITLYTTMHQNLAQQEMDQEKEPFACRYGCVCGQEEEEDDDDDARPSSGTYITLAGP